jgi:citrate lyase gamma subunit
MCSACAEQDVEEMPVQPRLEVGPVGDHYEQEADTIAGRVMAMRDADVSSAGAAVQRACAACSSDDRPHARRLEADDEAEVEVRARRDGGSETIAASDSQLTSGGAPLPAMTRDFFEGRLGRDLGDVRVHQGGGAHALNDSISARAFTYKNHIWLGANENTRPSFTIAHELAHVMQQTAPGPVGPSPQRVQRIACSANDNLFFFPKSHFDVSPFHDDTTQWATDKDRSLMGEVRVPNANRAGFTALPSGVGSFGFADLVRHTPANLVGMGFQMAPKPATPPVPAQGPTPAPTITPRPWHTFQSLKAAGLMTPVNLGTFKSFYRAGKKFDDVSTNIQMDKKAAPRWAIDDFERDASTAPTDIRVGEVKFGGGRDLSAGAKTQLETYATGFSDAAKGYEQLRKNNDKAWAGSNVLTGKSAMQNPAKWDLSTGLIDSWSGPVGWDRLDNERTLVVARWLGHDKCIACDNSPEFKGHQFAQHDAKNGFVWIYAFFPATAAARFTGTAKAALADPGKVAADLKSQLMASPTQEKKPVKRPLDRRARPRRRVEATRDRPGRARAKKTPKPVPKEDAFAASYETWKTKQKTLTSDFDTLGKSKKGTDAIGALLFDTAMVNTFDISGKLPTGVTGKPPAKAAQATDRETLNTIMLMSGVSGRFLGAMRKTFGGAFIKVINIYEKLRDKFKAFMEGRKKKSFSTGSRLARAAMKIGGMIFAAIVHHVLPQIAHLLIQCIERGFVSSIEKMFGEDIQALVGDKIDAIHAKITQIEEDVKAAVEKLIGTVSDDIIKRYEDILKVWETVGKLIGVAKDIINVIRVATCAAGGLETVGIACVVAGVDFVLGLFDVSPGEALAASLLGTCTAQKLLAEHILTIKEIVDLPKTIAQAIVDFVRPILPSFDVGSLKINLADMLCEKVAPTAELPAVEDITCGSGGSEAAYPEGKSWKPPPGVDPNILNRKPTDDEIKQNGRLPQPGTVPDRPKNTAPPPPRPDATPGGSPPPSGGGGEKEGDKRTHGVREGTIDNPTSTVNVNYFVHGIGGGFAAKDYGGAQMTVYISAVDSNAVLYGPDKVDILIYRVFEKPDKKGVYRIDFEPIKNYVLISNESQLGFEKKRREGQVGAKM